MAPWASPGYSRLTFESVFKWSFIGVNGLICFLWNRASEEAFDGRAKLQTFMSRNFLLNVDNSRAGRWWTYLTAAGSHQAFDHLFNNMLAFYNYVPIALRLGLEPVEIILLSVGSAVAGSAACVMHWKWEGTYHASALGASGLVWGLGMVLTLLRPHALVACPPLPRKIPLWMFTLGSFSYDFFGLGMTRSKIGHAAHLGGMAYGAAYYLIRSQVLGHLRYRAQ